MGSQTLTADAALTNAELENNVGDATPLDILHIDDSPTGGGDGNFWVPTSNNVNVSSRVSFPTPDDPLTDGADLQTFRMRCEQFDEGQTGTPTARIELWENGVLTRAGSNTDVTTGGVVITFTWNATEVSVDADVEFLFVGTKAGGGPTVRNSVILEALDWIADTTPAGGGDPLLGGLAMLGVGK